MHSSDGGQSFFMWIFTNPRRVDFTDVYSPVVNDVTFRIAIIIMMVYKLGVIVFDIETAFLLYTFP